MLCPICLQQDISVSDGVMGTHLDTANGICPMSGKPAFVWGEASTRMAVPGRSGGRCEYCGGRATNMHHRKNRSQGGLWSPANVLHLCGSGTTGCHGHFTHHPALAYRLGISVRRNQDPAVVPVRTPDGPLWLSDNVAPPFPGWAR